MRSTGGIANGGNCMRTSSASEWRFTLCSNRTTRPPPRPDASRRSKRDGIDMESSRVGEILGVWRLGQLLGSGGMGDVYLAERIDGVVRQTAAIKILRAPYKADIRSEEHTSELQS